MVYSRATTSAMADRWVLPEGFLVFVDMTTVTVRFEAYSNEAIKHFKERTYWECSRKLSSKFVMWDFPRRWILKRWLWAPRKLAAFEKSVCLIFGSLALCCKRLQLCGYYLLNQHLGQTTHITILRCAQNIYISILSISDWSKGSFMKNDHWLSDLPL